MSMKKMHEEKHGLDNINIIINGNIMCGILTVTFML